MALSSNDIPDDEVYEFEVLGGLTYSQSERPPFWGNEMSLHVSGAARGNPPKMDQLPLADFPLIDDFEVRLESMKVSGEPVFGYHVYFFSFSRGYIANFPWWDHVEQDLIRGGFQIPLGDFQHPFSDLEQSWEIIIAVQSDFIYVLQGNFDAPIEEGYSVWFKVNKDVYLAEWQKAIALCRKTFGS